ncbi:PLP-dependent aminotransferase family protein [Fulvimarina sp. 2208YS6-2-32]|uniref:PLP-dependent aminotransferase family protein n=1 Tax=Fulvimarina uroteuthidis TaxID=3098149 RepID=A0ABU5I6N4_9HYPH|nr:PLP-dependent aminotransferase family protein [Fulvimarina sp. 2208YS6-2-32]MDY8111044.1 PLP-dependent aminotransferase family protein [Fulvimarina sp. 2208YS6-2-32]
MASDPLALEIEKDAPGPLFLAIAGAITRDIMRGRLKPGARLPGTRALARQLGVHRNTVDAAYQELTMQGWLHAEPARGTFVAQDLPESMAEPVPVPAPLRSAPVRPRLAFSDGAPDPRLVPDKALARAFRRALLSPAFRGGTDYGDARGTSVLRHALSSYLASDRGVVADPARLLITRGSQMALFLAAKAAVKPGQVIAVEDPGYPLAWKAFRAAGAAVRGIPVDAGGLSVAALDAAIEDDPRIAAVYVTPHHQYPTTVTMGAARRLQLLDLVERHGITLIEDDYDHEYRFEGRPVLPLAGRAPANMSLIYVGSFSKLLSPGLRLGYAMAPEPLLGRMAAARAAIDRQGDTPLEAALADLIRDGDLGRHARKARRIYRARRDVLTSALSAHLDGRIVFDRPAGGLALWLRCVDFSAESWAKRAEPAGLALLPGPRFALDFAAPHALRLGYAALDEGQIARAVDILARSLPD